MVLPPSAQKRKNSCFETIPVFGFLPVVGRGWGLEDKTQGAGPTRASRRDHESPPSSYWKPGKGAGFPVVAALGRRVTLGGRIVT